MDGWTSGEEPKPASGPNQEDQEKIELLNQLNSLSMAEWDVWELLCSGWSNERIAELRKSSVNTVRQQRKMVDAKFNAKCLGDLVDRFWKTQHWFPEIELWVDIDPGGRIP